MTDEEQARKDAQAVLVTAERTLDTLKAMKKEHPKMQLGEILSMALEQGIEIYGESPNANVEDMLNYISDADLEKVLMEYWRAQG